MHVIMQPMHGSVVEQTRAAIWMGDSGTVFSANSIFSISMKVCMRARVVEGVIAGVRDRLI
jgi:hypothetical protein